MKFFCLKKKTNPKLGDLIGTIGTNETIWVDVSVIPKGLGENLSDRINRWINFIKNGVILLDTTNL